MSAAIEQAGVWLDESTHTYYDADGNALPSVTQITQLVNGLEKVPAYVLERKSQIGIYVHDCTDAWDRDQLNYGEVDPRYIGFVDAWIQFRQDTGFVPDEIELLVWSKWHRYAGTLDRIGVLNGKRCLIDIKTVAQVGPHVGLQLSGYQTAYNEHRKAADRVTHRYAVQLKEDGTYTLHPFKGTTDQNAFVSLVNIHNWQRQQGIKV